MIEEMLIEIVDAFVFIIYVFVIYSFAYLHGSSRTTDISEILKTPPDINFIIDDYAYMLKLNYNPLISLFILMLSLPCISVATNPIIVRISLIVLFAVVLNGIIKKIVIVDYPIENAYAEYKKKLAKGD